MTRQKRVRPFLADPYHYQKNLDGSATTEAIPAVLTHPGGRSHDDGIAIMRGGFFTGVLTLEDARRVADSIHDLIDAAETA
jgi:hypothetical protein